MNFNKINIIFLFGLFWVNLVFGQPCLPRIRLIDKQVITSNGDVLLLRTNFYGDLMDVFYKDKSVSLNYILISKNGKIKKDTILELSWNERYYDFMSCKATYKYSTKLDDLYTTQVEQNNCALYFPFSQKNKTIIEYFLGGDRKFAYDITIDKTGKSEWILYDVDTIRSPDVVPYHNDFTKYSFFKNYLEKKHNKLNDNLPTEQFEYLNEKTKIKIKNRNIELNKNISDNKWTINGGKWQILLDGDILAFYRNDSLINKKNLPLINIKDNIVYITVFNKDYASCRGYGQDVFPITYAIDIKKGKIIWKQEIKI